MTQTIGPVEVLDGERWAVMNERMLRALARCSHGAVRVYLVLRAEMGGRDTWYVKGGLASLATLTGVSRRTCQRAMRELVDAGLLVEHERRWQGEGAGGTAPSAWQIAYPSAEPATRVDTGDAPGVTQVTPQGGHGRRPRVDTDDAPGVTRASHRDEGGESSDRGDTGDAPGVTPVTPQGGHGCHPQGWTPVSPPQEEKKKNRRTPPHTPPSRGGSDPPEWSVWAQAVATRVLAAPRDGDRRRLQTAAAERLAEALLTQTHPISWRLNHPAMLEAAAALDPPLEEPDEETYDRVLRERWRDRYRETFAALAQAVVEDIVVRQRHRDDLVAWLHQAARGEEAPA